MSNILFQCDDLSCVRGGKRLFHNLSFTVRSGAMVLISGENGSGKTSLLDILSGVVLPSSGSVKLENVKENYYSSLIVYIGHKSACTDSLTVLENIEFWAEIRDTRELIFPTVCYFGLQEILDVKYSCLSAGWKRRVALSKLLIFNAQIWLIDEPFVNLDKKSCNLISNLITTRLDSKGIVIVTDHSKSLEFTDYILIDLSNFK